MNSGKRSLKKAGNGPVAECTYGKYRRERYKVLIDIAAFLLSGKLRLSDAARSTNKRYPERIFTFCKGKAIVLRMAESGLIRLEPGIQVKKEGKFLGDAISFDGIKLSAQAAEKGHDDLDTTRSVSTAMPTN